ncbi:hypothetical protein [Niallia sp. BSM11]|uniref:hypothetical protein n=1 Tax=Niallia sp. BSM11 TaxID=3391576 RepID=UPI00398481F8
MKAFKIIIIEKHLDVYKIIEEWLSMQIINSKRGNRVNNIRRITPVCPKCKGHNTYDVIPEIPSKPECQIHADEFLYDTFSIGNAKYHCIDCNYKWKKYRGKKPYERIRVIYSDVGGFPGPYSQVKVDLVKKTVEHNTEYPYSQGLPVNDFSIINNEDIELFLTELHKCDFVNWAEEYKVNGLVMDGTHWSVRIEYDSHCEIKIGDNHFPKKWTKFCKVVSALSGNDFY